MQDNMEVVNNYENESIGKEKNTRKTLIIIIVIALILLVFASICGIFFNGISGESIVKQEVTRVFQGLKKDVEDAQKRQLKIDYDKDSIGLNGELQILSDYKNSEMDLSKLKDYKLNYNGALNIKGNEASARIQLNKVQDILDLNLYATGNNMFLDLKDLYNKTILYTQEGEIKDLEIASLDTENIEKVLTKTENFTKEYIESKDISKTSTKKELNKVSKKYTTITYKINVNDYSKKLLEAYRKDKEILDIISKLMNQKKDTVEELLKSFENELESKTNEELIIKTYVDGLIPEVKGIEIIQDNNSFLIEYGKDNMLISVFMNNNKTVSGSYVIKEKKLSLEAEYSTWKINFTYQLKNSNNIVASLNCKSGTTELSLELNNTITVTKDNQKNNMKLGVTYKANDNNLKATIISNSTLSKNAKVEKINTENAVKGAAMTSEDIAGIMNKISEKVQNILKEVAPGLTDRASDHIGF